MDWIELAQDRDRWRALVTERIHCRDPGVDGRIILSWIFKKIWGYGLD
jgi:hypothetical protein